MAPTKSPPPDSAQQPDALKQEKDDEHDQQTAKQLTVDDQLEAEQDATSDGSYQGDDAGPGDRIEDFDWEGLLDEYETKLGALNDKEAEIYADFDKLINYFGAWAETVQSHELERSWKRINTRQAHVNIAEDGLEAKREHYVRVVQAFQSALQLLNGP